MLNYQRVTIYQDPIWIPNIERARNQQDFQAPVSGMNIRHWMPPSIHSCFQCGTTQASANQALGVQQIATNLKLQGQTCRDGEAIFRGDTRVCAMAMAIVGWRTQYIYNIYIVYTLEVLGLWKKGGYRTPFVCLPFDPLAHTKDILPHAKERWSSCRLLTCQCHFGPAGCVGCNQLVYYTI